MCVFLQNDSAFLRFWWSSSFEDQKRNTCTNIWHGSLTESRFPRVFNTRCFFPHIYGTNHLHNVPATFGQLSGCFFSFSLNHQPRAKVRPRTQKSSRAQCLARNQEKSGLTVVSSRMRHLRVHLLKIIQCPQPLRAYAGETLDTDNLCIITFWVRGKWWKRFVMVRFFAIFIIFIFSFLHSVHCFPIFGAPYNSLFSNFASQHTIHALICAVSI